MVNDTQNLLDFDYPRPPFYWQYLSVVNSEIWAASRGRELSPAMQQYRDRLVRDMKVFIALEGKVVN
jgi:hypothetical protein